MRASTEDQTVGKILQWVEESEQFGVLPCNDMNKKIRIGIPQFRSMFNMMQAQCVSHCCCKGGVPGTRCCSSIQDIANKMAAATEDVICGVLRSGSPSPCTGKWFTCAVRLRGVLLGIAANNLLPRAWAKVFQKDLRQAHAAAEHDDAGDIEDERVANRKRHRKVSEFLCRPNLTATLLSLLLALSPEAWLS